MYNPTQSAYRRGHSTETALLCVLNYILRAIDRGEISLLALLDQTAAFDLLDHPTLLHRLEHRYGICGIVLLWFKSYLEKRLQAILIAAVSSSPTQLDDGVPQGSVMGPILYTLYSAPLHDIVAEAGVQDHEFADDRQLYTSLRPESASSAVSSLSESIAKSKTWMDANHLKLNEGKTDALVVSSSARAKVNLPPLVINGVEVVPSSTVRNLGVILDSNLTMTAHISAVCRRAFFHLRRIVRIKKFLSPAATAQLIHAFVASQLDYGNALLVGLPSAQLDRLPECGCSAYHRR